MGGIWRGWGRYNEIALEKNFRYFQRSLQALGIAPDRANYFFASGDRQPTVRYLDPKTGAEQFKSAEIPHVQGGSTRANLSQWFQDRRPSDGEIFFYFTGHGARNRANAEASGLWLWPDDSFSVRAFTSLLDRLPPSQRFVTVMSQCYSGAFANLIYEQAEAGGKVAAGDRCGFFATLATLPSVGCTPEVNEADYQDYSSSFFAGLTGRNRIGQPVVSADYNQDGRVSYQEAHTFAKIDADTPDIPLSTREAWLYRQTSVVERWQLLRRPMAAHLATATPDRQAVVRRLSQQLGMGLDRPFLQRARSLSRPEDQARRERLRRELVAIAVEHRLRTGNAPEALTLLQRLERCENSSWRS
ncbi:MAG: Caspase domain-containing protein [Oscillatoriales cyanobacterium SM2_1_8]|nr:Caspase domain-containing protein [Oscillatoriales cyanobacterium SM2_1_8]